MARIIIRVESKGRPFSRDVALIHYEAHPIRSHCKTPSSISRRTGRMLQCLSFKLKLRANELTDRSHSTETEYAGKTRCESLPSPSP